MERALGIGGLFWRSADPERLIAFYRDGLGLDLGEHGLWPAEGGATVVAAFDAEAFPGSADQQTMLNLRVRDLDAMLAQVRAAGGAAEDETQDMDGVGRFGWVTDPDGRRVELWEPVRPD